MEPGAEVSLGLAGPGLQSALLSQVLGLGRH